MKTLHHFLLCLGLTSSLTLAYAYAPVVDESENFAITSTPPEPEQQRALAHDDTSNNSYFGDHQPSSANGGQEIARLLNQLQELQQSVQELRGQIDNQNHIIETLKNQQLTLYKDLDERLTQLKSKPETKMIQEPKLSKAEPSITTPPVPAPAPTVETSSNTNPADEQISYMAAYSLVEKKEFIKAELALQDYIKQYPQSGYTPNAEYWLGEIYLQQKNHAAAIAHFENIVNNFPASSKHADALYKLGQALNENGQTEEAKAKFQAVIQQYPNSQASELAQKQLNP